MPTSKDARKLRWMIFVRIAPVATLLLLTVVILNSIYVHRTLMHEVRERVNGMAAQLARHSDARLTAIQIACEAVASNEMVVAGISDIEHRQTDLLSYFRSLRIPGPINQTVTMTDAQGKTIASTARDWRPSKTTFWQNDVINGQSYVGVSNAELVIAVPISSFEQSAGMIIATFGQQDFFTEIIGQADMDAIAFRTEDSLLFASKSGFDCLENQKTQPTDSIHSNAPLKKLPGVEVTYWESRNTGLRAAKATDRFQMIQFAILFLLLLMVIVLASHLASQPLQKMLEQVNEISAKRDLQQRVPQKGPTEFRLLARGFNQMLSRLQHATVSRERYREKEERLALAIQGAKDGLWDWELSTENIWYSKRYKEILGYSDEEFPNRLDSFKSQIHPDDAEATWFAVNRHKAEGAEYDIEHRIKTKSGDYLWVRSRGAVNRDSNGVAIRMSGTMQDIAELKRSQECLERSNQDLEQFAVVASHDLQEPLRKVASFCALLKDENWDELNDAGKQYVDFAIDGSLRMGSLVQDLLLFAKVGSKDRPRELIDTNEALAAALLNLEGSIDESEAVISSDPLPPIQAHRREVIQLFQNLIGNAIKYRSQRVPYVRIRLESTPTCFQFSIEDNGIGIAPEYRDQVFGIFKRLHSRKRFSGTGIGLAVSKRIVEQLGGKIWVGSKSDPGSKICFTVPIEQEEQTFSQNKGDIYNHVEFTQPAPTC